MAGRELVCFSWVELYRQEADLALSYEASGHWEPAAHKENWDQNATWCDMDFLNAALTFLRMPISEALESDDFIVRIFAILDRRTGKRRLREIAEQAAWQSCPPWVRQFYALRLENL